MAGFEKFRKAVLEAANQHYKPLMDAHRDELGETIKNHLFELEGPRQINRQLNARDQYFGKMFQGFLEIQTSLETLEDIHFYIRRFPFTGTRIAPERYLQFHVETHFTEIYVLRERLDTYVTLFQRQFRKDPHLTDVQARCDALAKAIENALHGVVLARGQHVHKVRFSDDGIDRLASIALLTKGPDDDLTILMKDYYRRQRREVKKTWSGRTKANLKAIKELLDVFFEALFPIAFDAQSGALRYPNGARA